MLRFCATVCSAAMALKSTGSAATVPDGSEGGNRQQNFSNLADTYLHVEFGNKSQMALLPRHNGGRNVRQCSHDQFMVCPQLKGMTFTKMAKMFDCCVCSQTWSNKTPCQSIFWRKTKWLPMVL
jgi:hypothetical protein